MNPSGLNILQLLFGAASNGATLGGPAGQDEGTGLQFASLLQQLVAGDAEHEVDVESGVDAALVLAAHTPSVTAPAVAVGEPLPELSETLPADGELLPGADREEVFAKLLGPDVTESIGDRSPVSSARVTNVVVTPTTSIEMPLGEAPDANLAATENPVRPADAGPTSLVLPATTPDDGAAANAPLTPVRPEEPVRDFSFRPTPGRNASPLASTELHRNVPVESAAVQTAQEFVAPAVAAPQQVVPASPESLAPSQVVDVPKTIDMTLQASAQDSAPTAVPDHEAVTERARVLTKPAPRPLPQSEHSDLLATPKPDVPNAKHVVTPELVLNQQRVAVEADPELNPDVADQVIPEAPKITPQKSEAPAPAQALAEATVAASEPEPFNISRGADSLAPATPLIDARGIVSGLEQLPTRHVVSAQAVAPAVEHEVVSFVSRLQAKSGEQVARIEIHPPELGSVTIDVKVDHGAVRVELRVDNHDVKMLLDDHLGQLRTELSDRGLQLESFDVDISRHHNSNERQSSSSPRQHHAYQQAEQDEIASAMVESLIENERVNLLV